MQEHLYKHFQTEGHKGFVNEASVTFIDKTDGKDTKKKKKILEKGLDFAHIQTKINEPELREDFEEVFRIMRVKWYFWNKPSESFSNKPAFCPKCNWKPPEGHPNLEVFLSNIENELFKTVETQLSYSVFLKKNRKHLELWLMIVI